MKQLISVLLIFCILLGVLPHSLRAASADSRPGLVSVSSGSRLNVRKSPSTSASVVSSLPGDSHITLLSQSGQWWQVEYGKGLYGYCHSSYITPLSGLALRVSTQSLSLNVRSGPGTSYQRVDSLAKGEIVLRLSSSGGWSRILYHGRKTGYVSSQYLSSTGSSESYPKIALNLPNFKQTDSRWANVTLGSSGKTIAQIGCATTAVAMMESYRTGSTVYPDGMSKKLQYTPSGNLYWPSHYTVVTQSQGYLSGIYHLLKQGKPVLFGAKTSAGKQHWVVITGFSGGNSLTAAGFSIHDPGSNSRTNLQQFVNDYPIFYKYFHY